MSYTGFYSALRPIGGNPYYGVKILDWGGWQEMMKQSWQACEKHAVYDEIKNHETYPAETYRSIRGFAPKPVNENSNDPEKVWGLEYNIPRLGYYYGDSFIPFWEDVSRFTEPFSFYHSPSDGPIPRVDEVAEHGSQEVLHVVARDGSLTATKFELGVSDMEVLHG